VGERREAQRQSHDRRTSNSPARLDFHVARLPGFEAIIFWASASNASGASCPGRQPDFNLMPQTFVAISGQRCRILMVLTTHSLQFLSTAQCLAGVWKAARSGDRAYNGARIAVFPVGRVPSRDASAAFPNRLLEGIGKAARSGDRAYNGVRIAVFPVGRVPSRGASAAFPNTLLAWL
jgi:hypothetical protein